jgi:hypothetical protein
MSSDLSWLRTIANILLRSEYHSISSVYGPPARGYSKKNDMETFVWDKCPVIYAGLFIWKL